MYQQFPELEPVCQAWQWDEGMQAWLPCLRRADDGQHCWSHAKLVVSNPHMVTAGAPAAVSAHSRN
jgi:hypothetical protein